MAKVKASPLALEVINDLVQEVTKNKPDQVVVKKLMMQAGLDYEPDLIRQMGAVLALVSKRSPDSTTSDSKKLKEVDL